VQWATCPNSSNLHRLICKEWRHLGFKNSRPDPLCSIASIKFVERCFIVQTLDASHFRQKFDHALFRIVDFLKDCEASLQLIQLGCSWMNPSLAVLVNLIGLWQTVG
jgi:hypothetical protein